MGDLFCGCILLHARKDTYMTISISDKVDITQSLLQKRKYFTRTSINSSRRHSKPIYT